MSPAAEVVTAALASTALFFLCALVMKWCLDHDVPRKRRP